MTGSAHPCRGFTLLELMVTMVIAAILMMVAVPGFLSYQRSSAVYAATSSFSAALNAARAEAIKRAKPTFVMPTSGSDWSLGWMVFVDLDGDDAYDKTKGDVLVLTQAAVPSGVSVPVSTAAPAFVAAAGVAYVRYDSYGIPRSNATTTLPLPNAVDFSAGSGSTRTTRRVILGIVGRPRTCDPVNDPNTTCTLSVP